MIFLVFSLEVNLCHSRIGQEIDSPDGKDLLVLRPDFVFGSMGVCEFFLIALLSLLLPTIFGL